MLAGPNFSGEEILTADLDLGDIARGKYDFDVVGTLCAARRLPSSRQ
jgi:hypothetical protein